tara:strand:- start:871 stop:1197 length:327 start_codon:yes stop_codon:yes gene_type:complete
MNNSIKNINATQLRIAALLTETAEAHGYDLEYSEIGYNENSGYVYLWSEMESYTIALTDFEYNRGEEKPDFIISCPESGEEFIADSLEGAKSEYEEYCEAEELEMMSI